MTVLDIQPYCKQQKGQVQYTGLNIDKLKEAISMISLAQLRGSIKKKTERPVKFLQPSLDRSTKQNEHGDVRSVWWGCLYNIP